MIVDGKKLLNIIIEDGAREEFPTEQDYENDCFNIAKLLLFLLKTESLGDYLSDDEFDETGLEIKNQIKRACNIYGIRL